MDEASAAIMSALGISEGEHVLGIDIQLRPNMLPLVTIQRVVRSGTELANVIASYHLHPHGNLTKHPIN